MISHRFILIYLGFIPEVLIAATVSLTQTSINDFDASNIAAVSSSEFLDTGIEYTTTTAPQTYSGLQFTYWSNDSYLADLYRDSWGRSLNPISFVLLEDTVATAHYLPASYDSDFDTVPDWFEIEYYNTLSNIATTDTDGDGLDMATEHTSGTHPLYGDSSTKGGVEWVDSGLIVANLAGYASYVLSSNPAGTVDKAAIVPPGTEIITTNLASNASFGYWEVDGVRQADAWGVAYPQVSFTVQDVDRTAVAYLFSGDSDLDGVADAYEQYYYGTLTNDETSDTDGDGLILLAEYTAGTSPIFGSSSTPGGVFWVDSNMVVVNLAGFSRYVISSVPAGIVELAEIVADGTTITSPNLTQSHFGYWEIDGVRQEDAWGVALNQVSFLMDGADVSATAYLFSEDTDFDGINDGYELYHYGTLANDETSDTEGDGLSLLAEFLGGTHPLQGNSSTPGGVFWIDSDLKVANLQPFERAEFIPLGDQLEKLFSFDPATVTGLDFGSNSYPVIGDWDGDGDVDIFILHEDGLAVYENTGSPYSMELTERSADFGSLSTDVATMTTPSGAIGDIDGDGMADLILGGATSTLSIYLSNGSFSTPPTTANDTLATASTSTIPTLGEFNGDTYIDLLILLDDGSVAFHQHSTNNSAPFSPAPTDATFLPATIISGTALSACHIDTDEFTDVVVSDIEGRIWEFVATGHGTFSLVSKVWAGSSAGFAGRLTIAAADINGDGDDDAFGGLGNGGLVLLVDPRVGRPGTLKAISGPDSILLKWDPNRQSRILGYYVYRAEADGGPFASLTGPYIVNPEFVDVVTPAVPYFYQVTSLTGSRLPGNSALNLVESEPSDVVEASAGNVTVATLPVNAPSGTYVQFQISVDNAYRISGTDLEIRLSYDPAILTPRTQIDPSRPTTLTTGLSSGLTLSDNAATANGELIINGSGGLMEPGEGNVFRLYFKVDEAASNGTTTTPMINIATLQDVDTNPLNVTIINDGYVDIKSAWFPGDLDGDGTLSESDLNVLKQLIKPSSPSPTANELLSGDLNGDRALSIQDLGLLLRLLDGLPIDEGGSL